VVSESGAHSRNYLTRILKLGGTNLNRLRTYHIPSGLQHKSVPQSASIFKCLLLIVFCPPSLFVRDCEREVPEYNPAMFNNPDDPSDIHPPFLEIMEVHMKETSVLDIAIAEKERLHVLVVMPEPTSKKLGQNLEFTSEVSSEC
jgi:hypothetical protein